MIKRSFHYQQRTREDILERANASAGDFDNYIDSKYKTYKVRDGKNMVRILPPTWEKARHYGYEIWLHYGIGADNQAYLSRAKMKAEPCPLAEAYLEADREGNEKLAKALRARKRILMWVIDRQAEDEGPQLWAAPFTVDKDIATLSTDEDTTEVLLIDEPTAGYDVRFYREGKGLNTDYPAAKIKLLGPSPLSEDEDKAQQWLDFVQANPIPNCLKFYSYEHISKVFNGHVRMDSEPPKAVHPATNVAAPLLSKQVTVPDDEDEEDPVGHTSIRADEGEAEVDVASIRKRIAQTAQVGRRLRPVVDDD